MAANQEHREDLFAETSGLPVRGELKVAFLAEPVVAGFRESGGLSVYFGQDEVYQFNGRCELRRAFAGGRMLKAEDRRLIELRREKTPERVLLHRRTLDQPQRNALLAQAEQQLAELRGDLSQTARVLRSEPTSAEFLRRLADALDRLLGHPLRVAERPNA